MRANVGGWDRAARIAAGTALIVLTATETIGAWGWIGVLPLATGILGRCPAYLPFGWSTCTAKQKS